MNVELPGIGWYMNQAQKKRRASNGDLEMRVHNPITFLLDQMHMRVVVDHFDIEFHDSYGHAIGKCRECVFELVALRVCDACQNLWQSLTTVIFVHFVTAHNTSKTFPY